MRHRRRSAKKAADVHARMTIFLAQRVAMGHHVKVKDAARRRAPRANAKREEADANAKRRNMKARAKAILVVVEVRTSARKRNSNKRNLRNRQRNFPASSALRSCPKRQSPRVNQRVMASKVAAGAGTRANRLVALARAVAAIAAAVVPVRVAERAAAAAEVAVAADRAAAVAAIVDVSAVGAEVAVRAMVSHNAREQRIALNLAANQIDHALVLVHAPSLAHDHALSLCRVLVHVLDPAADPNQNPYLVHDHVHAPSRSPSPSHAPVHVLDPVHVRHPVVVPDLVPDQLPAINNQLQAQTMYNSFAFRMQINNVLQQFRACIKPLLLR